MPLVRVEVRNVYGLGAPEMYREANREEPKEILDGVAVSGLVGVLRQLGDLTDFAAEVFHGLQEELMMTTARSRKLMGRVQRMEAAFSPLQKAALAQRRHLHLASVPGLNWHARIDCEKNKLVYTDMPQFIVDSYEECGEPPKLHLLDRFDPSGPGSCFKRYSDPSFFRKASARKGLEGTKGSKIKKLWSRGRSRVASLGSSFFNPGGSDWLGCNSLEANIAAASDDVRIDPTQGDDHDSVIQKDDRCTHLESFVTKLNMETPGDDAVRIETMDRTGTQTCDQDLPKSDYIDINFDEFEIEKDIFMDAPSAIEPEYEIDMNCTRKQDMDQGSKSETEAAELVEQKLKCQNSYSESRGLAHNSPIISGCKRRPISASPKSSFAALCCISCISPKDGYDSVTSVDKSLNPLSSNSIGSYVNGDDNDGKKAEYASCIVSPDNRHKRSGLPIIEDTRSSPEPAPETSETAHVSLWTNGNLLGLQPSKPHDCGLLNCLSGDEVDKTRSFKHIEGGLSMHNSMYQECEESNPLLRKIRCKISLADLGIELGNVLPVAAKKHPEDSRSLSHIFEPGNRFQNANASEYQTLPGQTKDLFGHEPPISSPSSSPPLRHMKLSFQRIDCFETSKLKLKFACEMSNDENSRDILPLFQLVPEVFMARYGGSDSDDDTFYRSSSSSSLDRCHGHQSESNSEQWDSSESPTNKDPYLLSRISSTEYVSPAMEHGKTIHGNKSYHSEIQVPGTEKYIQSSHSCRSCDLQRMKAINHSSQDNITDYTNSPIPPVQWVKPNSGYAFNLNDSLSTISQQPKPAPLSHDNSTIQQKSKRQANKGKSIDEMDFLQLIRSKSFNLRPTVMTKTTTPSSSPAANVHVSAILHKANSIRQAVGSDHAEDDDDDGDWSDT